jgi:plastocyanin
MRRAIGGVRRPGASQSRNPTTASRDKLCHAIPRGDIKSMDGGAVRNPSVTVAVVLVALAAIGYRAVSGRALAADRPPGFVETFVARKLVRLSIPRSQRSAANPHAADATAWKDAVDHFGEHCATCHGTDGRGRSEFGRLMYPPVPDLTSEPIQQFSDGELFAIIGHGVRWTGMPAFQSTDTDDEIWKLVSLIRRLPSLTAADLKSQPHDHGDEHHHDPSAQTAAATVDIDGTTFEPGAVTIALGQTVRWINKDPFPHNVTSKAAGLHSGDLDPDQAYEFEATKRGTFDYVCTLHPGMRGVLRVE